MTPTDAQQYFVDPRDGGSLRSTACQRTTTNAYLFGRDRMCFNCRNITRNAAVHKRLIRYHRAQGSTSAKSRHDYLGPQLVLDRCRKLSATVRRLTNFLRSARDRATQLSLTNKLFTRAQANATRGDLVGCATKMARWVNSGMAGTDTAAVDMVTSVLGNLVMAGQKYTKTEQAFYKVIRVYGGPRLTEFVARNLAGPSRRTPERWLQLSRRRYRLGLNARTTSKQWQSCSPAR